MFTKAKNLETAFRHVRIFTIVITAGCLLVIALTIYAYLHSITQLQNKIYVLNNGKVLEALSGDRKDNIEVEARDHVRTFHELFFRLEPDDKVNRRNVAKALYLADESGKAAYDNLSESGYYAGIVSGNIYQKLDIDSIRIDLQNYPYRFRCYATEQMVRTTSTVVRNMITEGELRNVPRSDNNPHGFLVQHWSTLENKDIQVTHH
jgi:conjugative transposon TraK protein